MVDSAIVAYFWAIILDTAYTQWMWLFLNGVQDYTNAGLYSGALRLVMPLLLFPTAIIYTIFPVLSKKSIC
jgi:O-antigen/teichoic acid export membrane protein